MRVAIYGAGYVGLVTAACLAEVGNDVLCMDVDQTKIDALRNGKIPIYEPGLEPMVLRNVESGRLRFTTETREAVEHGLLQFIAVGTPPDEDGSADLRYVLSVAGNIAEYLNEYRVIVDKSTVPVGTADKVQVRIREVLDRRGSNAEFDMVSNPEFLKEGAAVTDFMKPDRIIVGTETSRATETMRELYAPFNRNHDRLLTMDILSAEFTKYAANSMLATKISFMNEMANIAEHLGADIEMVRQGIGSDSRIGYSFIYPGCGYGGSCFPKDISALTSTAIEGGYTPRLLQEVDAINRKQKTVLFDKISNYFKGELKGKVIGLWGLAFKPNTDDMRDAPSRVLMEALWGAGATVRAYDPIASEEAVRIYGKRDDLFIAEKPYDALEGADVMVLVTEWQSFKSPDFERIRSLLTEPAIFDGRNIYEPATVKKAGMKYFGIGRI